MSTDAPADQVFAIDLYAQFQPIRLPAEAFKELHSETRETLDEFVAAHRKRFPQEAGTLGRRGR